MSTADAPAPLDHLPPEVDGVPVRETLRALFSNPENGTPDNISKAGCLALALKSNEVGRAAGRYADFSSKIHILWNAWRDAFPRPEPDPQGPQWVNAVDFSGVDFRDRSPDFSGFCFGDGANFSGARWGDRADFSEASWGHDANFSSAHWGSNANFSSAHWGSNANFRYAEWGSNANFSSAHWGSNANFRDAEWGEQTTFHGAQWGNEARFEGARWGEEADFSGARWGPLASFIDAQWRGGAYFFGAQWGYGTWFRDARWGHRADFRGAQWAGEADFSRARFEGDVNFSGTDWLTLKVLYSNIHTINDSCRDGFQEAKDWAESHSMSPYTWRRVRFNGAQFHGAVTFANREFLEATDFGFPWQRDPKTGQEFPPRRYATHPTRFAKAPEFHGCKLHQDTSFQGAKFPEPTGSDEAARAYRTLKLAFSQQQAVREEQRFFQHEMAEETLRETGIRRWLFRAYQSFSDFGFSVGRPLFGLILLPLPLFAAFYLWFATMANPDWNLAAITSDTLWHQLFRLSVTEALPVPGTDLARELRTEIFGTGGVASLALLLEMIQKTLSLAGLFFAGLALRNLFKLK